MTIGTYDHLQDLSGLQHPMPTLRARSALMRIQTGEILKLIVNNPLSADEIHTICQQMGHHVLKTIESENKQVFWIEKSGRSRVT